MPLCGWQKAVRLQSIDNEISCVSSYVASSLILQLRLLFFADPYCTDEDACKAAFEDLGYEAGGLGFDYVGDYSIHGCYGYKTGEYAGHFFYGTGSTYGNDSRLTNLELPEFRIPC